MKQVAHKNAVPTANIAVNKSRLKLYEKNSEFPVYYLQKDQEFQIELFNPTTDTVLAKIILNNNPISQGGLVLRPGERVFLDRYIDVAKKFKFDTYEVANTKEVKEAIKENGDFKVEFYRERTVDYTWTAPQRTIWGGPQQDIYFDGSLNLTNTSGTGNLNLKGITTTGANFSAEVNDTNSTNLSTASLDGTLGDIPVTAGVAGGGHFEIPEENVTSEPVKKNPLRRLKTKKKSIETGRVEMGSQSDQKFETVQKDWDYFPFHTIEYKLKPVSQKVNTTADIQTKRYCTNCGTKTKPTFKFCPSCGTKV